MIVKAGEKSQTLRMSQKATPGKLRLGLKLQVTSSNPSDVLVNAASQINFTLTPPIGACDDDGPVHFIWCNGTCTCTCTCTCCACACACGEISLFVMVNLDQISLPKIHTDHGRFRVFAQSLRYTRLCPQTRPRRRGWTLQTLL